MCRLGVLAFPSMQHVSEDCFGEALKQGQVADLQTRALFYAVMPHIFYVLYVCIVVVCVVCLLACLFVCLSVSQ